MKKSNNHIIYIFLVSPILLLFCSCSRDADPGGKIWWLLIGFPLLGVAYFVGGLIINLFQPKQDRGKKESPEPIKSIIVGALVIFMLYVMFKAIF